MNLLSNHSSLVEDVLLAFPDKSYKSWVHPEQGIVSPNSRCRSRQNTGSKENHSPALLYHFLINSPSQDWHSNLSVEANLFSVSSFSGLCTLTSSKRHPGLISISTRERQLTWDLAARWCWSSCGCHRRGCTHRGRWSLALHWACQRCLKTQHHFRSVQSVH